MKQFRYELSLRHTPMTLYRNMLAMIQIPSELPNEFDTDETDCEEQSVRCC